MLGGQKKLILTGGVRGKLKIRAKEGWGAPQGKVEELDFW